MPRYFTPSRQKRSFELLWPGLFSLVFIGTVLGLAFSGLLSQITDLNPLRFLDNSYLWRLTAFTFFQAFVSTALATLLAIPVARALSRRPKLPGRRLFLQLASLSLIVPTIVGVFGIIAVHGRQGWVNQILGFFNYETSSYLYGLTGILIAHVFFNAPLLTRIFLETLETLPREYWRSTAQLGMSDRDIFRLIEWPGLRKILPASCGLVFLLCFTSFIIVLILGGGPSTNTLEVAIYQALRFDFDIPKAATLAMTQLILCFAILLLGRKFIRRMPLSQTEDRQTKRFDADKPGAKITDTLALFLMALLVLPPLLATIWKAINPRFFITLSESRLWDAALTSLMVSLLAGLLSLLLAIGLALALRSLHLPSRLGQTPYAGTLSGVIDFSGSLILLLPPFVLATGLFITLKNSSGLSLLAPLLVIAVNALMALPFVLRLVSPAFEAAAQKSDLLCSSLDIRGLNRLRLIDWPQTRQSVGLALGLAVALSTGDLSVIALFGTQDFTTLPLYMYQKMGSYRFEDAAAVAFLLCLQSLTLFIVIDRLVARGMTLPFVKPRHRKPESVAHGI
ncbi:thiamine/thiamine pyrophosphate ABC transporter permease [Kiloniella laminariae]|uniref:Thiamine transport system permease protein ThiP n=1 Tax=Kiloniella laminariae TaxID=454162 RepID=A0ABT4LJP7_9PROT|nr:thiamine/thiamine pyrophosphate ABC transporter permease [Kiloniella laminariae]MCZ4281333.1 thiamine/thiamine pyrophosphate ABC transporter permease [Kiloniella laminariae]